MSAWEHDAIDPYKGEGMQQMSITCHNCGGMIASYSGWVSHKCERQDANGNNPVSPPHYQQHPSGIECIQITEHMNFCLGNAVKYLWRAGLKGDAVEDLKKAVWYIEREIARRGKGK